MKELLISAICTLVLTVASLGQKPNVLFIAVDDLNTRLGCYGAGDVQTPALDALAASGLRFERAYCQYPVCNPSRSSFLTGLRPETTRVLDNRVELRDALPNVTTLPECFKKQGYWTAAAGKIFHSRQGDAENSWDVLTKFDNERNPVIERLRREFEELHGSIEKRENQEAWKELERANRKLAGGQTPAGYGPTAMTDAEHKDGKNVRQIEEWLESKAYGEKPFFAACGVHKPHVPFWAPQKYFDLYPPDSIRWSVDPADDWDDIPPRALSQRYKEFGVPLGDDTKRQEVTAAYHAAVTFLDAQMGYLFDTLKRLDLWDSTIIVFFSDHGFHLGEHGMWGKVSLFEEVARVPLLVRVPGQTRAGSVSNGLVELIDLYPTLTELCGLKAPENLEGVSFVPLLKAADLPWKVGAYTVVNRGSDLLGRAVRSPRWRYAEWGNPDENELYDLVNDPRELTNLAKMDKHQRTVEKMRVLLNISDRRVLLNSH